MTSQGVKFMNSGDEFARTKKGTRNSYNSSDDVNMLHWDRVTKYKEVVDYYKGLRQISTVYTPFHDDSSTSGSAISMIKSDSCIAYTLTNNTSKKSGEWGKVAVILNAGSATSVSVPGSWTIVANDKKADSHPSAHAQAHIQLPLTQRLSSLRPQATRIFPQDSSTAHLQQSTL